MCVVGDDLEIVVSNERLGSRKLGPSKVEEGVLGSSAGEITTEEGTCPHAWRVHEVSKGKVFQIDEFGVIKLMHGDVISSPLLNFK